MQPFLHAWDRNRRISHKHCSEANKHNRTKLVYLHPLKTKTTNSFDFDLELALRDLNRST